MIDKLSEMISKLFFVAALLIVLIAIVDWLLGLFGWTFSWVMYSPGRLLEFSAMLIVFVIAGQLRQIGKSLVREK